MKNTNLVFPVVREANNVGDCHNGGLEEDDARDEAGPEDFGEAVNEPEGRFHQGVEDVGRGQMVVVEQAQEGNQN